MISHEKDQLPKVPRLLKKDSSLRHSKTFWEACCRSGQCKALMLTRSYLTLFGHLAAVFSRRCSRITCFKHGRHSTGRILDTFGEPDGSVLLPLSPSAFACQAGKTRHPGADACSPKAPTQRLDGERTAWGQNYVLQLRERLCGASSSSQHSKQSLSESPVLLGV